MNINLYYNNAYKWWNDEKNYVIGYIYYKNEFYKDKKLLSLISNLKIENLNEFINKIDGAFLFIINRDNDWFIVSDLMRNFPLFYKIENDIMIVTDDIMLYDKKNINKTSEKELLSCGWVSNDNTLFDNIFQIEAHQIIKYNQLTRTLTKKKYFNYQYNITRKNDKQLILELDKEYNNSIKKLIEFLDGRTAVIPLSGGNDSRLLVYYLKKNNYDKIITFTYGTKNNSEVSTSKKVAEYLNVDWHFIEYKNKSMQKKFNNKKCYKDMADYCGRGYSKPHMQEWEAVSELSKKGIINSKECVFIPGYSGDFIAGSHITQVLFENELTFSQLISHIVDTQYQYAASNILNEQIINKKLIKRFDIKNINKKASKKESIELYEEFDFEERQAKYINNAIRTFDYQGFEWYLPFWDKLLVEKWLSIPFEKKYKIGLFIKFTMAMYGDLMEYAPIYKMKDTKPINPPFKLLKKIYRIYEIYKKGFLNFYGYLYFRTYIKYFLKTKNYKYNKIYAQYYIDYVKKEVK